MGESYGYNTSLFTHTNSYKQETTFVQRVTHFRFRWRAPRVRLILDIQSITFIHIMNEGQKIQQTSLGTRFHCVVCVGSYPGSHDYVPFFFKTQKYRIFAQSKQVKLKTTG